jgi:hypothetical protein
MPGSRCRWLAGVGGAPPRSSHRARALAASLVNTSGNSSRPVRQAGNGCISPNNCPWVEIAATAYVRSDHPVRRGGHGHRRGLSRHPEQLSGTAPCPSPWRTTHCERSLSEGRKTEGAHGAYVQRCWPIRRRLGALGWVLRLLVVVGAGERRGRGEHQWVRTLCKVAAKASGSPVLPYSPPGIRPDRPVPPHVMAAVEPEAA